MPEIGAAFIGIIGTVIVSLFSYIMAKKAGISPFQDSLIDKLKDLVEVQTTEIANLKKENTNLKETVDNLTKRVVELEKLTVNQAVLIDSLPKPVRRMRTRPVTKIQEERSGIDGRKS